MYKACGTCKKKTYTGEAFIPGDVLQQIENDHTSPCDIGNICVMHTCKHSQQYLKDAYDMHRMCN